MIATSTSRRSGPGVRARTVASGVLLFGLALALSGCTGGDNAPAPRLVSVEVATSPLESDEFVKVARAADLGRALAWNALDFSLDELTSTNSERIVQNQYDTVHASYVSADGDPQVRPGPDIWLPVSVTPKPQDDTATILICRVQQDWIIEKTHPKATFDLSDGSLYTITIGPHENSGSAVYQGEMPNGDECDATGAPVDRFDPAPVAPESVSDRDITEPDK
jgi:hypothetical protein